jgi:integrase/recombinase XerC
MDARKLRPKTVEIAFYSCSKLIRYFQGTTMASEITSTDLKNFLAELHVGLAPQSVQTILRKCKAWFAFLVRDDILKESPFRSIKSIRIDNPVLPHIRTEDLQHLIKVIGQPKTILELRDTLIFFTALDTGMRLSELAGINRSDLDLPKILIARGKMGRGRIVCVGHVTSKLFRRYLALLADLTDDPETVWLSVRGERLTPYGVRFVFERISKRHSIHVHPHKVRRTTALQYLTSKTDLHTLRQLMGWSSFEMLQRYVEIDSRLIEDAVSASSPVDRFLTAGGRRSLNRKL